MTHGVLLPAGLLLGLLVPTTPADAAEVHPDVLRRLAETGAPVKVWIAFADKGFPSSVEEDAAVAGLAATWPARSLARRALRRGAEGLLDARDLPVAPAYLAALGELGIRPLVESRWLDAVSAEVDAARLDAVAALPFVRTVRLVARSTGLPARAEPAAATYAGSSFYGYADAQLAQIGVPALHALGHTGQGVVIGVLDSGFATTHDAFHTPGHELDVIASYDFVDDDPVVGPEPGDWSGQHEHGTLILGTLAGYLPDTYVGSAHDASFVLCKTEDVLAEFIGEEDNYVAGLEFAELHGADLCTSSLGYIDWYDQSDLDGETAITTIAVNVATENGLVCITAAGNAGNDGDPGTSTIIAPADAFDVVTCGSVSVSGALSSFSSSGPTADGRTKPEVLAMGESTISIWPYDDVQYAYASGTSLSTPLVAGAVACLLSAHPEWSVASIRQRLVGTASFSGAPRPDPLGAYGWGIVAADDALALAGSWTSLGGGVAGVQGVPLLTGSGSLVGDEVQALALVQGRPFGSAFLVIGVSQLGAPFKGGTLVPSPDIVVGGLPLDGNGALAVTFPWIAGLPTGVSVYLQEWIPDPAATFGFAGSNGVRGTTP